MKIATVKQECSNGDKATITGTVKWIGDIDTHQGREGEFTTQTLLLADGIQTDDKCNSIFCQFSADGRSMKLEAKGEEITVQGTVNIYEGKTGLRNCKAQYPDKGQQPAPQNRPQAPSQPRQPSKDRLIVAQVVYKGLARIWAESKSSIGEFDVWFMGNQLVLKRHIDLIMQYGLGERDKTDGTQPLGKPNPAESKQMAREFEEEMPPPTGDSEDPY